MNGPMYAHIHMHIYFMCVGGGGGAGGGDYLSRAERERMSDFVEIVTFHCMYMSIVRYGLFVLVNIVIDCVYCE